MLRDYDTALLYNCWFSLILRFGCWYINEPLWQEVSVYSLILWWPLRPLGLFLWNENKNISWDDNIFHHYMKNRREILTGDMQNFSHYNSFMNTFILYIIDFFHVVWGKGYFNFKNLKLAMEKILQSFRANLITNIAIVARMNVLCQVWLKYVVWSIWRMKKNQWQTKH